MNVGELMKILKKHNPNTPVCNSELVVDDHLTGWVEIHNEITMVQKKEKQYTNANGNEVSGVFISLKT